MNSIRGRLIGNREKSADTHTRTRKQTQNYEKVVEVKERKEDTWNFFSPFEIDYSNKGFATGKFLIFSC